MVSYWRTWKHICMRIPMDKDMYVEILSRFPPDLPVSITHIVMRSSQEHWRASHARIITEILNSFMCYVFILLLYVYHVWTGALPSVVCVGGSRNQKTTLGSQFSLSMWVLEDWTQVVRLSGKHLYLSHLSFASWCHRPVFGGVEKSNSGPAVYKVGNQVTEPHSQHLNTSQQTTALCYFKGPY